MEEEKIKIRSFLEFFEAPAGMAERRFAYRGDELQPYSFEVFNVGGADILHKSHVLLKGGVGAGIFNSLKFPRVGIFKRSDIIEFNFEIGVAGACYIRSEIDTDRKK